MVKKLLLSVTSVSQLFLSLFCFEEPLFILCTRWSSVDEVGERTPQKILVWDSFDTLEFYDRLEEKNKAVFWGRTRWLERRGAACGWRTTLCVSGQDAIKAPEVFREIIHS